MVYTLFYLYNCIMSFTNNKKIYKYITLPIFLFLFGLRYRIGADWGSYEKYFYGHSSVIYETGYKILNKLIYSMFADFNFVVFITFLFVCISYFKNIEFFTPNYNVAIVAWLGVSFLSFGIIRQNVAIAIFFIALRYVEDKKWLYILLILLASYFHNTAIILVLLPLITSKKIENKNMYICLLISMGIYVLKLGPIVINLLQKLPVLGVRLAFYINAGGVFSSKLGLGVRFIEAIILFGLCSIFREKLKEKYKYFELFYTLLFVYLNVYLILNDVATVSSRVVKYFEISHIILFSYLIGVIKDKYIKTLFLVLMCIYFGLRYYMTITGKLSLQNNSMFFLPYRNIFFE